jgi:hypothetical protein
MTIRYLSLEWIDAVNGCVSTSESLAQLSRIHDIGVTQVVTDGPEGDVTYHFQVGDGEASFGPGPAPREHVRLEQSWETAVAVATATVPAQDVFIKGLVKVTGDVQRLIATQVVFAALDAAFEQVRIDTEYS